MSIFSLNEVKSEQVKNIANNNFASWPESGTYGYYGGGAVSPFPTRINTISRLDFSSETLSNPGKNLPFDRDNSTAVSNYLYGYFGGSQNAPTVYSNLITRLDFSSETISLPGKNLPYDGGDSSSVSGSSFGYFAGGYTTLNGASPAFITNDIAKFDFSNETTVPFGQLPTAVTGLTATSSSSYGYFGGGSTGSSVVSTISRLDLTTGNVSLPGKNLPYDRFDFSAISSSSYGYFSGGSNPSGGSSIISRLDFSTENTVSFPSQGSAQDAAVGNSSYGYFSGGEISAIRRLDFSSETVSLSGKNFPTAVKSQAAFSGGQSVFRSARGFGTYGYFGGAYSGNPSPPPFSKSFVFRFDFSTEQFTPVGSLPIGKFDVSGFSNKDSGYFLGGQFTPGTLYNNGSSKISFSNETISASTPTSTGRAGSIGLNSKYCGYLVGGAPTATWQNNVTKFDYSSESGVSLGNILPSSISSGQAGVDCGSYGYMSLPLSCTINRLDFSNETISNPGNNIPQAATGIRGISHTAYGYFVGGANGGGDPSTYYNTFIRLDFSSETTSLPGKNLPSVRRGITTTQSSSYGYCVGGEKPDYPPPPVVTTSEISTISRIDFSTEDVTNIATNFPSNISNSSGISNHNKYNFS